jgi:hypothetical protein
LDFIFRAIEEQRIVMLHGVKAPPDDGWNDYLGILRGGDVTQMGLLAITAGGAPNAAQRHGLNQVLKGRPFARAIVHDSTLVRGILTAVSWFAPGVEAFSPACWQDAAVHAKFHRGEVPRLGRILSEMHAELSSPIPWFDAMLSQSKAALPKSRAS